MLTFLTVSSPAMIDDVVAIAKEIWTDHYTPIIGESQVDYMLDKFQSYNAIAMDQSKGFDYIGMYVNNILVGYISLSADVEKSEVFLSKIYIHKSVRGSGFGIKALTFIENYCVDAKADSLWLTVNKENVSSVEWYKLQGFIVTEEIVADIGNGYFMDDFKMEKRISLPS